MLACKYMGPSLAFVALRATKDCAQDDSLVCQLRALPHERGLAPTLGGRYRISAYADESLMDAVTVYASARTNALPAGRTMPPGCI